MDLPVRLNRATGACRKAHVFISYSSKDRNVANMVCALLEDRDHRCWIAPRNILPGKEWGEAIIGGIRQSKIFVLIFSHHVNASPQILREVERAVNGGMPIIPFRIEDVVPEGSLEYFMSVPHWLDALSPPVEDHIERLAQAIEQFELGEEEPLAGSVMRQRGTAAGWWHRPAVRAAASGGVLAVLVAAAVLGGLGPPMVGAAWLAVACAFLLPPAIATVGFSVGWRRPALRAGLAMLAVAALGLYLWASATFVVSGSRGGEYVRGSTCTPDAELVYEGQCPDLPAEALADAEFRPELLWTSGSIARAEQMIGGGWIGWVLLVSLLLGSYHAPRRSRIPKES